jgi:hypothetical protein
VCRRRLAQRDGAAQPQTPGEDDESKLPVVGRGPCRVREATEEDDATEQAEEEQQDAEAPEGDEPGQCALDGQQAGSETREQRERQRRRGGRGARLAGGGR